MKKIQEISEEICKRVTLEKRLKNELGDQKFQELEILFDELTTQKNIHPTLLADFFTLQYEIYQMGRVFPLY